MVTGHSLGGYLAEVVATTLGAPAAQGCTIIPINSHSELTNSLSMFESLKG